MGKYGIPYMGSKNKIAEWVCKTFPSRENFYDLFGGGFAISHCVVKKRSKDFKNIHYNEIKSDIVDLVKRSIAGEVNYDVFKPEFIDRESFFKRKDSDAYIRCCWSFGNNQSGYMFSEEIESYKKSMHNAIVFNNFDDLAKKVIGHDGFSEKTSILQRRLFLRNRIEFYRNTEIPSFIKPFLNERQLQKLERLQQLQQLQQLQRLEQLHFYSESYEKIEIKENSIIYCDPPYADTANYQNNFDTAKFLEWAASQKEPVFISEYEIKDKRFFLLKEIDKMSMLCPQKHKTQIKKERIYGNRPAVMAVLKK